MVTEFPPKMILKKNSSLQNESGCVVYFILGDVATAIIVRKKHRNQNTNMTNKQILYVTFVPRLTCDWHGMSKIIWALDCFFECFALCVWVCVLCSTVAFGVCSFVRSLACYRIILLPSSFGFDVHENELDCTKCLLRSRYASSLFLFFFASFLISFCHASMCVDLLLLLLLYCKWSLVRRRTTAWFCMFLSCVSIPISIRIQIVYGMRPFVWWEVRAHERPPN